jgi:hypothetical protein
MRTITATQSAAGHYDSITSKMEDVRTLAGQTCTVSFWAKAASGTPNIGASILQNFGSGGSSYSIASAAVQTITTSWVRYSFQIAVPSISGKTIGTSSFIQLFIFVSAGTTLSSLGYPAVGLQNNTFDIWGVQVEAGSVATPFQTATGTLQGELAACQRYLPVLDNSAGTDNSTLMGYAYGTNGAIYVIPFGVQARVQPTGATITGAFNAYAKNVATTITPTYAGGSVNNGIILGAFTITAGEGSRIYATGGAKILFTGCEL